MLVIKATLTLGAESMAGVFRLGARSAETDAAMRGAEDSVAFCSEQAAELFQL